MAEQGTGPAVKAEMVSPLAKLEKRFVNAYVPHFPKGIESHHLTLLTIPWSIGLVVFGLMARVDGNMHWLWGSSLMLFMQWFTDTFDGAVGRYRNTGLIKWGFYADHFLDTIFMPCIFVGYAFLMVEHTSVYLMLILGAVYAMVMVHSFLEFGATNEFHITYLGTGPTEIRLYFIICNTFIVFCGAGWLEAALPYILVAFVVALTIISVQTQLKLWDTDMREKENDE